MMLDLHLETFEANMVNVGIEQLKAFENHLEYQSVVIEGHFAKWPTRFRKPGGITCRHRGSFVK
jgi:hypothetical protein